MEKWLKDLFPVLDIEHDCIVSKAGDITVAFELELPEIFTLSDDDYESLHQFWVKAIKVLPKHSVLHKQDWYLESTYKVPESTGNESFLAKAANKHFEGRPYLSHSSYLFLTKCAEGRKPSSSMFSNLLRPHVAPEQTLKPAFREAFEGACGQFRQIMTDSGYVKMKRLTADELYSSEHQVGLLERYFFLNGAGKQKIVRDMDFKDGIKIGQNHCHFFSLGNAEDLPALCGSRITYDKYSTDHTKFPLGFVASLGLMLPFNHIYNQYIIVEDAHQTIKRLESKRLRLQSLSAYSRENTISRDATNAFLNEALSQQRLPVKAHFNIMVWSDDKEELKDRKNGVASALAQLDATSKEESWGAPQLFWAGIPGNGGDFPMNDCFDTFAAQASCFLAQETNYRSDPAGTGIRFCDRFGVPVTFDPYDRPRAAGLSSNLGTIVCGTSGGGKSMTVNHILRCLYDQGAHCVTIDIGGSYRGLCELVGGYYYTYEESNPIKFNPFYLSPGDVLDTEKKESLKSLLVALWKQDDEHLFRSEYVALSNALQGYYRKLEADKSLFPCFNTFYDYLQADYKRVLESQRVKDKDFDVDNFLYVLRSYYDGGEFDYLLNAHENLEILHQRFVVIELDNIKDHPVIFSVVALICVELVISKMRKLPGVRKILTIDEAWKAITKSGMAQFIQYAFKTMRKFNGIPNVVTQELDDLISSQIIKDAIINNSDVKIQMDMRKFVNKFDKLQSALGMSDKGKTILLSVNKDNREIFIDVGGQIMKVFKNELCPAEYFAYTTEGKERVKVLEYARRFGSMEKGIEKLVEEVTANRN
ncbi:MAG: TraG family conjugative transposon ATPase [Candidatus Pseudobacter hemicellulosilyticus]|uniref:TraG family conjugative transposon ATPase n=1 Tax=Candidatus Pseudobacter hemicellulosilyticus TaxID=3121375 RepID=A0AAJ5WUY1_9BACT|nr:MAG: TraG family conjugative transposon ATPase [Pseudobacter sp.]